MNPCTTASTIISAILLQNMAVLGPRANCSNCVESCAVLAGNWIEVASFWHSEVSWIIAVGAEITGCCRSCWIWLILAVQVALTIVCISPTMKFGRTAGMKDVPGMQKEHEPGMMKSPKKTGMAKNAEERT